jgi:hypothetical protein
MSRRGRGKFEPAPLSEKNIAVSALKDQIKSEAEKEAEKQKFDKMIISSWLNTKSSRGDCDGLFPEGNMMTPGGILPEKLEEGFNLLKENYPHFDVNPKDNIFVILKGKLEGRKTQVYGYIGPAIAGKSWCGALLDTEKELQLKEKFRFIENYIKENQPRVQRLINEINSKTEMAGLRKLVGNNSNANLLKFNREEELKGLFNVPSNKTRTRRRKNRKTLRKRR